MPLADEVAALPTRELRLAIVGRPNAGKSSLLNRLLGEERAIVSPVAGTTRDTVDTLLETKDQTFRVIDTAGIRRKGKTQAMAEKLSVVMARKSLERADVAIVLLDAAQGIAALDAAIAGYAVEAGCSIIVALNKWDLLTGKDTRTGATFERKVREQMKFLSWAPVVSISALKGQRVQKLLPLAVRANEARRRRSQNCGWPCSRSHCAWVNHRRSTRTRIRRRLPDSFRELSLQARRCSECCCG